MGNENVGISRLGVKTRQGAFTTLKHSPLAHCSLVREFSCVQCRWLGGNKQA
jgi:hypothetical protein